MFTKLLIAASTLVLIAYGMEPDKYDAQRTGVAPQHAVIKPATAAPYQG